MQTDQFILIHNALCVSGILKEMFDEYTNAMDGYIQANRANLIRLLIAIFRQYKNMRSSKLGNTNYYQSIVESSIAFMQEYYAQNITCQTLSSRVYLSDGYLNKIFKKITGESPLHFLQSIRITKAAELLLSTSLPIATVASRVGYADMKYFIKLSNVKTDLPHRRKSPVRKKRLHFRRKRGILYFVPWAMNIRSRTGVMRSSNLVRARKAAAIRGCWRASRGCRIEGARDFLL